MAKRKPLTKKIRFEVFKRDKFTCQYCGSSAPDVILEVDHIKPVASGGTNDLINLITSCKDCNRGKGKVRLDDSQEVQKQSEAIKELAERREQIELMVKWREELVDYEKKLAERLSDYIASKTDYESTEAGLRYLRKEIKEFSFTEVMEAIDISFDYYYSGTSESWEKAFWKIGGICYNRRRQQDA